MQPNLTSIWIGRVNWVSFGTQILTVLSSQIGYSVVKTQWPFIDICNNCATRTPGSIQPGIEVYTFTGLVSLNAMP